MVAFWPDPEPADGRHAAPTPTPAPAPRLAGPPQRPVTPDDAGRVRLARGGLLALALAVVVLVGAVLATAIVKANSEPDTPVAIPVASPWTVPPVATETVVTPTPTAAYSTPPTSKPTQSVATSAAPKLPAAATFEVAASDKSVTVRSQNLGTTLYRVTLAGGGTAVTPKVAVSGTKLRLTLVKAPATVAPPVTIVLNSQVKWALKLSAGNTQTAADLTGSKLSSLELAGGANTFDLDLPRATGTLPVRITHGMSQLKIKTNGVPVRLTMRVGAGTVIVAGSVDEDVTPGKVITSDGWADATNRVDVDSVEGIGTLTVNID
ncbi:hypothetical protein BJ973_008813 [Actinoplanes tereljensis]|uniref:Uncharacterized protein n=1 Tax=Paractinoplanes tereljensis TaxID=571912 RepID=A0A919NHJ7_9ACTN|nr:hypothetical protein [Actinoplanes tereljensis]GIF18224.1 hypothetical protein Ate02nite_09540 [Actinoplanes tereljensis]